MKKKSEARTKISNDPFNSFLPHGWKTFAAAFYIQILSKARSVSTHVYDGWPWELSFYSFYTYKTFFTWKRYFNSTKLANLLSCDNTPSDSEYVNFFKPFHFLAGDQLVVPIGASHISSLLQEIQSREWEERTKNKRTIRTWVNSKCKKRSYVTLHSLSICRLMLVWISSENSTTHEEC